MSKSFGGRGWAVAFVVLLSIGLMVYASAWTTNPTGKIESEYGKRRGKGGVSVNGTTIFAEMFRQRGSKISTWSRLSPRLSRSDVIVWAPNSFELPDKQTCEYFENKWLGRDDGRTRTLIYVARDYDAASDYWMSQAKQGRGRTYLETRSNAARAKSDHAYARSLTAKELECEWFSVDSSQAFVDVTASDGPWAADLDRETISLSVAGKLEYPQGDASENQYEILLGAQETPLIVRMTNSTMWPAGQVIIVVNGASVLNLPLVHHENRKIASRLIDQCGPVIQRTTFLESGPMGLPISNADPKAYSGFDALKIWPINSILLHLIIAGILFCVMVFPIFGRPREVQNDPPSNFGKHIRAMGELLALTHDRQAAMAKVQLYRSLKIEPLLADHNEDAAAGESGNPFKISKL